MKHVSRDFRREKNMSKETYLYEKRLADETHDTHTTIPWVCSGIRNMSEETHFMCVSLLQASFRTSSCL